MQNNTTEPGAAHSTIHLSIEINLVPVVHSFDDLMSCVVRSHSFIPFNRRSVRQFVFKFWNWKLNETL